MGFVAELRWRGLIQDIMPETESYLDTHSAKGYVGFDPTADSLHIGNLVPIMLLVHLQRYGHSPYALVGGATGMIGDPSGKSSERQFLSEEILRHNEACVHKQLSRFLDFEAEKNPAKMVNNYDWFKEMDFLTFLREVGKYLTINYMKAKDSVKSRIESEQGISYTEFTYQLVQGYDFYHLYKHEGVCLQMGGADQWGNITTGTELIRKKEGHEAKAFALTAPLITREDNTKFGKTADGKNIWLDEKRTSAYQFYQYWLNVSDSDAEKYIKVFTFLSQETIEALILNHQENASQRLLQKTLASEVTAYIHGEKALKQALTLTDFFFGSKLSPETLLELSAEDWASIVENTQETDRKSITSVDLEAGIGLLDFLVNIGLEKSKGDARRSVQQDKTIKINGLPQINPAFMLTKEACLAEKYIFIQKGKKNKCVVEVV